MLKKSVFSMIFMPLTLSAFCFFGAPSQASAQRLSKINGGMLANLCASPKQAPVCNAYLAGLMDSEVWAGKYDEKMTHEAAPSAFCIAPEQNMAQIRGVVASWLKAHSESAKMPAGKAAYLALHTNYPCKTLPDQKTKPQA